MNNNLEKNGIMMETRSKQLVLHQLYDYKFEIW